MSILQRGAAMRWLFWLSAFAAVTACGDSDAVPSPSRADAGAAPTVPPPIADASSPSMVDATTVDATTDSAPPASSKYDSDGPFAFTTVSPSVTSTKATFVENVYVPSSGGPHPLVSLSPGLMQTSAAYAPYAKRLASWGFVVIMRDDPGVLVASTDMVSDIAYAITTWLPGVAAAPLAGAVDFTRIGLTGHSRGGKLTLNAAAGPLTGKVKAWIGIDPVDLCIPPDNNFARTTIATLGFPVAFLGGGVTTGCAPATDSAAILFAASASPAVSIEAIGASHTQFEGPSPCAGCTLCTPMGTADTATVLAFSVRYVTAFFARELLGDATVGAAFEGAGGPADVAAGRVHITAK